MKLTDIARHRLAAQDLVVPRDATPGEIVARLGAVQAQDYFGGKWALGLRGRGVTDAMAERAVTDATIVRTHVLRPTWHFVAAADVRWLLALTGPRVKAGIAGPFRHLGIDAATMTQSRRVLERALRDGAALTRPELAAALGRGGVPADDGRRLGFLLMAAELDAVLCSGPRRGKQFTWALLDARVPPAPGAPVDRDAMLAELGRRYWATRGPATAHDFAMWSGLTVTDARRAAALATPALAPVDIAGVAHWMDAERAEAGLPARPARRGRGAPLAHLLPNYDEYFIGFRERGAILDRLRGAGADLKNVALSGHILAIDGQVVGGWRRATSARGVTLDVTTLVPLAAAERRAVDAAAASLGAHLGTPVRVAAR